MAEQNGVAAGAGAGSRRPVKSLGSLEAQLMDVLWGSPAQLSVQDVVDRLGADHNYKTVMTVLNRLVEKRLLARELDGRAYRYRAHQGRDDFLRIAADELVHEYVAAFGDQSAAHLADAVETLAPRPDRPAAAFVPPPPPPPRRGEPPPQRPPLAVVVLTAVVLQIVVFLITKRGR